MKVKVKDQIDGIVCKDLMMKLTDNDYYIMRYIGFKRGVSNASLDDASGFIDYYFRVVLTEQEFKDSIEALINNGFLARRGKRLKPTTTVKKLRKRYMSAWNYLFHYHDTEAQFLEAFLHFEDDDNTK